MNSVTGINTDGSKWELTIGDRVACEAGDDSDVGRIVRFVSEKIAIIAWDSGVTTPCDVDSLTSDE